MLFWMVSDTIIILCVLFWMVSDTIISLCVLFWMVSNTITSLYVLYWMMSHTITSLYVLFWMVSNIITSLYVLFWMVSNTITSLFVLLYSMKWLAWVCCCVQFDEGGTVCALAPIPYMVYWRRGYCLRSCAYPIYGLLTKGVLFALLRLSHIWFIDEGGTVCALAPIPSTVYITTSILTKISRSFLEKPIYFSKTKQILNVLRNLTLSFAFYCKIDTFNHFKKSQSFSGNLFIFSKNQKCFEHFEKTANFSCIPQHNCYIQSFQGKFNFWESMYFFKTAKKLNVLRKVSVSVEFYCTFATASHFLQFQDFFSKNLFFKI